MQRLKIEKQNSLHSSVDHASEQIKHHYHVTTDQTIFEGMIHFELKY